jgi:hypothetical protein
MAIRLKSTGKALRQSSTRSYPSLILLSSRRYPVVRSPPNSAVERPAQKRLIARPKQPLTARGRDITLASKLPIAFTESVGKSIDLGVLISGRQGGGADVGVALEIHQSAL